MQLERDFKIFLGDRYIGLYFFSSIPNQEEIMNSIEFCNTLSKHAVNACALYVATTPKKRKNSALLIVDAGHHLEPLLALSSAWATQVGFIFTVPLCVYSSTKSGDLALLYHPSAPMIVGVVRWTSGMSKSLIQNDMTLLKLISTVTPGLEIIRLYPNSSSGDVSKQDVETYIFSFHKLWDLNTQSKRISYRRKPYNFLLSHFAETYYSDLSYLLLRLTRLKSILNLKDVKSNLMKQIINRVTGVLLAINERLTDFQQRGTQVAKDVAKISNMFAEIDGTYERLKRLSQTLTVLEQIILTRSLGGSLFRAGVEIADDHFQHLAFSAIDNIILDATSCLKGTRKYVYGIKPGRVAIGGQAFRPLHKVLAELVGQYTGVYADENLIATDTHFDLANYGIIECYEIPIRYLLRVGSWPLIVHSIVETNAMRLSEHGQYRQVRLGLDLFKWWSQQMGYPLSKQFQIMDKEWSRRPRRFPRVDILEDPEFEIRFLRYNINPDIAKLLSSSLNVLDDIICTRLAGPAYVFALARFGLRGRLATLERERTLEEDSTDERLLSHPIARLSLCISTLKAENLLTSSVSDILPAYCLLPNLNSKILEEIDNLFVEKPFRKNDENVVQNIIAELTQGHVINERPLLLLNALWYAVIKGKPYANEPSLLLSLSGKPGKK